MNKIVRLTESQFNKILKKSIREEVNGYSDKVNLVKDFLDSNFLKATNSIIGDDGCPQLHDIVIWVDKFKQPKQYLDDVDLFYILQDKFQDILPQDEDDDDYEEAQEDVETIFDKAIKDAEKKINKKVTHNNRDNFLKQCIKDWYYNKISKNGNLTLYEAHSIDSWNINCSSYRSYLKERLVKEMNLISPYCNENTVDGSQSIGDINYMCDRFIEYVHRTPKPKPVVICNMRGITNGVFDGMSDMKPDLYHIAYKMLVNRAFAKWFFICPHLTNLLSPNVFEVKKMLTSFSNLGIFKSIADRSEHLPFYTPLYKEHISPLNRPEYADLKDEIMNAKEMTPQLNYKIEDYLNKNGYDFVELPNPNMVNDLQSDTNEIEFEL